MMEPATTGKGAFAKLLNHHHHEGDSGGGVGGSGSGFLMNNSLGRNSSSSYYSRQLQGSGNNPNTMSTTAGVAVFSSTYRGDNNNNNACGFGGGGTGGFACLFDRTFCDPFDGNTSSSEDENDFRYGGISSDGFFDMTDVQEKEENNNNRHHRINGASIGTGTTTATTTTTSVSSSFTSAPSSGGGCDNNTSGNEENKSFGDVVASLGKEMLQLSINEQTRINEEIHGVYDDNNDNNNKEAVDTGSSTMITLTPTASSSLSIDTISDRVGSSSSNNGNNDDADVVMRDDTITDDPSSSSPAIDLKECLKELHKELAKQASNHHDNEKVSSYRRACSLAPMKYGPSATNNNIGNDDATSGRSFFVRYLQSNKYDPKVAAERIILCFYYKELLFGSDKLTKTITLEDLDSDDRSCLRTGHTMFLPGCDMAGRHVLSQNARFFNRDKWINHIRAVWYVFMTALYHDEITFKRGIVYICNEIGAAPITAQYLNEMRKWLPLWSSFPLKIVSFHYCVQNTNMRPWIQFLVDLTPKDLRVRFRFHFGGHMECNYNLISYGMPEELLISDHEGNIRQDFIDVWIQRQKQLEQKLQQQQQQQLKSPIIATDKDVSDVEEIIATDKDVLLGRGIRRHPGNTRLSKLIEEHYDIFNASSLIDKTMLSWKLVRTIEDEGGRFLERDTKVENIGKWKVTSDETARYKVSYGFRTHSKLIKRKQKQRR